MEHSEVKDLLIKEINNFNFEVIDKLFLHHFASYSEEEKKLVACETVLWALQCKFNTILAEIETKHKENKND